MFEQLNNIDKAFKHIKLFTFILIVAIRLIALGYYLNTNHTNMLRCITLP